MLQRSTALLTIIFVLNCCVYSHSSSIGHNAQLLSGSDSSYESAFKQLDQYLSKQLPKEANPEANIEKASEWLKDDLAKQSDETLMKAVELFISLSTVLQGDDKCSTEKLNILIANKQATGSYGSTTDGVAKNRSKNRVNKVVDNYATEHARACEDVYRSRYETKSAQMDSEQVKRVQEFLDQVIVMNYFHKSRVYGMKRLNKLYNEIIVAPDPVKGVDSSRAAYIVLGDLTEHQPEESQYLSRVLDSVNGGKVVHNDQIRGLFTKYLVEPCRYYVEELGTDIFKPARIETEWYNEMKESQHDYYYGWARFRFCESFLKSDQEPLLKGILRLAEMS